MELLYTKILISQEVVITPRKKTEVPCKDAGGFHLLKIIPFCQTNGNSG